MRSEPRAVSVACTFRADGSVLVRRVQLDGEWIAVEQGRQWLDADGRHVLVLFPGAAVQELLLLSETLTWQLRPLPGSLRVV